MKTYVQFLDILTLSLLALAIQFLLSDTVIANSFVNRNGIERTFVVSWQSLLIFSTVCIFLRYVARNMA